MVIRYLKVQYTDEKGSLKVLYVARSKEEKTQIM